MTAFQGRYNDGLTAQPRAVTVVLEEKGLRIDGQGVSSFWPYDRLRLLDEEFGGAPFRLALAGQAERLTAEGPVPPEIFAVAPRLQAKRRRPARGLAKALGAIVLAVLLLFFVLAVAIPQGARWAAALVPEAWEEALGEQGYEQLRRILGGLNDPVALCEGPQGRGQLDRLAARLAGTSTGAAEMPRISILDHAVINAFALPGGRILVMRGLLDDVEGPDELAGVLAHEIGHIRERHALQGLMESLGIGFFFGLLLGDVGTAAGAVGGDILLKQSYSRELERAADDHALEVLIDAGIDAGGLFRFFRRLSEKQGDAEKWLARHAPSRRPIKDML